MNGDLEIEASCESFSVVVASKVTSEQVSIELLTSLSVFFTRAC